MHDAEIDDRPDDDGSNRTISQKELNNLNLVTQETRANLIQNIIGHRWMMPSKKELDYYNPSKSPGTITGHLNKLVEAGIVQRLALPMGEQELHSPNVFFALSDSGWELLSRYKLFVPQMDEIRRDHANVEKTDEIERYENAPRPTIDVDYDHPLKGDGRTVVDPVEYTDRNNDGDAPDNRVKGLAK